MPVVRPRNPLGSAWFLQAVALLEALDAAHAAALILLVLLAEVVADKEGQIVAAVAAATVGAAATAGSAPPAAAPGAGAAAIVGAAAVDEAGAAAAASRGVSVVPGAISLEVLGISEGTVLVAIEALRDRWVCMRVCGSG